MDLKKEKERILASAKIALAQLDKLIVQNIDLTELEPEKAKIAAQGKIEAIEGSFKILQRINEELAVSEEKKENAKDFFGVENKVR